MIFSFLYSSFVFGLLLLSLAPITVRVILPIADAVRGTPGSQKRILPTWCFYLMFFHYAFALLVTVSIGHLVAVVCRYSQPVFGRYFQSWNQVSRPASASVRNSTGEPSEAASALTATENTSWDGYSNMVCGRILYWLVWLACGWRYEVQWLQSKCDISRLHASPESGKNNSAESKQLNKEEQEMVRQEQASWKQWCEDETQKASTPFTYLERLPRIRQTARKHHSIPCVYVCNHQDAVDVLSMGAFWPGRVIVIGKESLRWYPLLGTYMWLSANVFIRRTNREKAIEALNEAAAKVHNRKWSLFLFCEGTRSRATTPKLLPFKKGAFHIARQQNVPIVPVVMGNYYPVYNFKEKRWTSADGFNSHVQIPIRVLPPMHPEDYPSLDELMQDCHMRMQKVYETIQCTVTTSDKKSK